MKDDTPPGKEKAINLLLKDHKKIDRWVTWINLGVVIVAAVAALWFIDFELSFVGVLSGVGSALLLIFNITVFFVLACAIGLLIWEWWAARRLLGWRAFTDIPKYRRLFRQSKKGSESLLVLAGFTVFLLLVTLPLAYFWGLWPVSGVIAFAALIAVWVPGHYLRPPVILFLTTSHKDTLNLVARIRWDLGAHLRVAVLLDDQRAEAPDIAEYCNIDNFRTREDARWRSVVHDLMGLVRYIVIDARWEAAGVIEEAQYLASHALMAKTIFLMGTRGECPALRPMLESGELRPGQLSCATETILIPSLLQLIRRRSDVASVCPTYAQFLEILDKAGIPTPKPGETAKRETPV